MVLSVARPVANIGNFKCADALMVCRTVHGTTTYAEKCIKCEKERVRECAGLPPAEMFVEKVYYQP